MRLARVLLWVRGLPVRVPVRRLCAPQVGLVFTLLHVTTTNRRSERRRGEKRRKRPAAAGVLLMRTASTFVLTRLVCQTPPTITRTYQELARWRPEPLIVFGVSFLLE